MKKLSLTIAPVLILSFTALSSMVWGQNNWYLDTSIPTTTTTINPNPVTLTAGSGYGFPTSYIIYKNQIQISLENLDSKVRGIQVDICNTDNYLSCTGCETTNRTSDFTCLYNELQNGCVRVVLFSFTNELIDEGTGPIFTLNYDVSEEAPIDECIELNLENAKVSDKSKNILTVYTYSGEFCFYQPPTCGDVYPRSSCGDGVVNIFDILEEVDIILCVQEASSCQMIHGDVPIGTPPYCGNISSNYPNCEVDDVIDIFDVLVIIDKALGRTNCCNFCAFAEIY